MSGGSSTRKGPKGQGQMLQPMDYEWKVLETSKSREVGTDEEMRVDEDG